MAPNRPRGEAVASIVYHMICRACREQRHEQCRGGNWCDCQHRRITRVPPVTGPPGD